MSDATQNGSWLDRLRQAFAQPVERLSDAEATLLGRGGPVPSAPGEMMAGATTPRQTAPSPAQCMAPGLSARDNAYFNRYYGPVAAKSAQYGVNPAFVLANGYESGYADPSIPRSTYVQTNDAFGMTRGDPKKMTRATSPQQNVDQLFANYGTQMRNVGSDPNAYVNALRGQDASGAPVKGWQRYNQEGKDGFGDPRWEPKIRASMNRMLREVPVYAQYCAPGAKNSP